jgi:hypothetical protein
MIFTGADFLRSLVIGTLAATLVGCSCFAPQQQVQQALLTETACTEAGGIACSVADVNTPNISSPLVLHDHLVAKPKTATAKKESPQHRNKANTRARNVSSKFEPKTDILSPVQADDKSKHSPFPIAEAKTDTSQSSSFDDMIRKAKTAIAAKIKNQNVEFVETVRGTEKDALGKSSVDIVCGHIRQENADIPFIYIVQKDEAYIGDMIGTTEAYKYLATCLAVGKSTP